MTSLFSRLTLAALFLAACERAPTLLIANTSGNGQWIVIHGDSSDLLFNDTVQAGEIRCWVVPSIARGHKVDPLIVQEIGPPDGVASRREPWMDSLRLDRSWTLRIRVSRFVSGSPEWQERWRKLQSDIARGNIAEYEVSRVLGEAPPSREDLRRLRQSLEAGAGSWPGAPRHESNVQLAQSASCEPV